MIQMKKNQQEAVSFETKKTECKSWSFSLFIQTDLQLIWDSPLGCVRQKTQTRQKVSGEHLRGQG